MLYRPYHQHGFTLVELAIVMVIMGLLVSGAIAGKSLYRASQLKAQATEIESYKVAIDNFIVQYNGIPGDIKNAQQFWPSANMINGNNNGKIENATESLQAWSQLSSSRMIAGQYTGEGTSLVIGENVPASRYNQAGYNLVWFDEIDGYKDNQGKKFSGNYLIVGLKGTSSDEIQTSLSKSALIPEDAHSLDRKLDNGYPTSGAVLALAGEEKNNCVENNDYNMNVSIASCILYVYIK